jgi:hypothetical protein
MRKELAVTSIAVAFAMPVFACGSAPTSTGSGSPTVGASDVVHETVVRLNADGKRIVSQVEVPRAEIDAMWTLRQQARQQHQMIVGKALVNPVRSGGEAVGTVSSAVVQDPTCNGNDLWISDNNNCNGGNLLCYNAFDGQRGTLSPFDTPYPGGGDWSTHVVVYSPGTETGNIAFDTSNGICWHVFEVFQNGGGDSFSCHSAVGGYSSAVTGHQNPNCTPYTDSPEVMGFVLLEWISTDWHAADLSVMIDRRPAETTEEASNA